MRSAVEGAYRKDLGIGGAKAFTKNLARYDQSGTVTGKLVSGQPLTPGDRLVLSRAYHDSLPIDISKPPLSKTVNTIDNIVRDYSIFSRKMPADDAFHMALANNIGTPFADNLLIRAAAEPESPLAKSIGSIIYGRLLTPFDTRILGYHLNSIAKANDPYIASEIGSRAEKAAVGVRNSNIAVTKASVPPVYKAEPAKPIASTVPIEQKGKNLPLTLPEKPTLRDIDKIDTHSRANSNKVPD